MTAPSLRLVLVMSPYQNAFFVEIAEVIVAELRAAGIDAIRITEPGSHVVEDDDVFVLMPPHEYVTLEGDGFLRDPLVAGRTIGISAEQPHQVFFQGNVAAGRQLGAMFDFSAAAVEALRGEGVAARHLRVGYTELWDCFQPGAAPTGPPRLLYLGNKRPRRLAAIAANAEAFAAPGTRLLVSDNRSPNLATGPAFVTGAAKRDLLAATRLLVNIHQGDEPYFEWLRFCEAAHCGTPVLSEASRATEPFQAGVHFESFELPELGRRITDLLDDDRRLGDLRAAAYERLRERRWRDELAVLVDAASALLAAPPPAALPGRTRSEELVGRRPPVQARSSAVGSPGAAPVRGAVLHDRRSPALLDAARQLGLSARVVGRWRRRIDPSQVFVVAPPGTRPVGDGLAALVDAVRDGADLATGVIVGHSPDSGPMLEGVWPWQTWRLGIGQHLGRLLVVRGDVATAAGAWLGERALAGEPHVALAAWVADRGGTAAHVPRVVARCDAVVDPEHEVSADAADWLRRTLHFDP